MRRYSGKAQARPRPASHQWQASRAPLQASHAAAMRAWPPFGLPPHQTMPAGVREHSASTARRARGQLPRIRPRMLVRRRQKCAIICRSLLRQRLYSWPRGREPREQIQGAPGEDGALVGEKAQQHRQQLQVQAQLVRLQGVPPAPSQRRKLGRAGSRHLFATQRASSGLSCRPYIVLLLRQILYIRTRLTLQL